MKVFTEIQELIGKKTYSDKRLEKLKERFNPQKLSFYSVEFTDQSREACQCTVIEREQALGLIVSDMEKAEAIAQKGENQEIIDKVLAVLNKEKFLGDELDETDLSSIKNYSFLTAKPVIFFQGQEMNVLLEEIFKRTSSIFFFSTAKKETRSWLIKEGTDIVSAASKIHSDLARGFIRAEVYNMKDLDSFKSLTDAKQRGILKAVDKKYIVQDGDVVDIKFNV